MWIENQFNVIKNGWINEDGTRTDAFEFFYHERQVIASLSFFYNQFGDSKPKSADELKQKDPNNKLGWHCFFDEWEKQGLLS